MDGLLKEVGSKLHEIPNREKKKKRQYTDPMIKGEEVEDLLILQLH
jgi:hypothetical protein